MPQKKILIVDADEASRNFIARKIQDLGFDILHAASGREGLIAAWRDHPDMVVADPSVSDLRGEEFAAKLRHDPRTQNLPLVALSSDHNPARIKSCREAGFNEYIAKSGQAVRMLGDVIARLFGVTDEAMKRGGLMIVFLSAKGGTGVSSLCANIGVEISKHNPEARVVVADLVFPIGSIAPIVGYEGTENIATLAGHVSNGSGSDFLSRLPKMETWRFHLLAGSPDPELSNQLNAEGSWDIVSRLKNAYDFVLVDIGRSLSRIVLPLISHADLLTLIVSADVSAISLTGTLLEYLKGKDVSQEAIYTILNRHAGLEGLSKRETETALGIKINAAIPYLDVNFAFANSQNRPYTLKFPNDTASIILQDAAREISALARKTRDG